MPKKKPAKGSQSPEYDNAPAVDAMIEAMTEPTRTIVQEIRKIVMKADRRVTAGVKWNSPSFYWNGWFATVNFRNRTDVILVLHHGPAARSESEVRTAVADPSQLLKWHSADRASVTIASLQELRRMRPALTSIVKEWATYHSALPGDN